MQEPQRAPGREILVLCHRIPYPPNKGDKIRSFHVIRHLAARGWRIHLGALADDPADLVHVRALKKLCESVHVSPLAIRHKAKAAMGMLWGGSFSMGYFRDSRLQRYADGILARGTVESVLAVCAPMAGYVFANKSRRPERVVVDLMDVDSEKWRAYAGRASWPARLAYGVEARRLRAFERLAWNLADHVVLVSEAEAALFRETHGCGRKVSCVSNGVDLDYFSMTPLKAQTPPDMVFCGAMDYAPNVDAAVWFGREVLPRVREAVPGTRFSVVGAKPKPEVLALAALPGISVTGFVDDVRGFVRGATLCVAPLGIARGLQNKVLEAMAMGKPVLATSEALTGIEATPGRDVAVAPREPEAFARAALALLRDGGRALEMGRRARSLTERNYSWEARLAPLEGLLR